MTDLLLETQLDEEQREYVSTARLCAENLFHLLNATLEYSALTAGHLKLDETEFGLSEMVDSALATEREKAAVKGLKLTAALDTALPQTMIGDAARMQDLLGHLLDNAIKFTHRGSVDLKLTREGEILKIEVSRHGYQHRSPERQARIFESFHQVDSGLSRNYPGLGLGLALVQKLLALMGGKIEAESQLNNGSTFTMHGFPFDWLRLRARKRRAIPWRSHDSQRWKTISGPNGAAPCAQEPRRESRHRH